ncbi:hypothetical protein [Terrihabitans sp. B22-R8]|uniref:hypothetical protein n=1 Tax=Terrihabitans sp. B22-R8 TaxID=3425128 RepID=UPI00403C86A2
MNWSPVPDLASSRRTLLASALCACLIGLILLGRALPDLAGPVGDTDATLRLVVVRALAQGGHWFDLHIDRLQPPIGLDSHWSRLVDAPLVVLDWIFTPFFGEKGAEKAMWTIWPLALLFPLCIGCMLCARTLGGSAAMLFCAFPLLTTPALAHFRVGAIDHHNIQIVLTALSLAGTLNAGARWGALLAGACTGLLLAIGLEALPFAAIMGASIALRMIFGVDHPARARDYAAALAVTITAAFVVQTPPDRWTLASCDMLAVNLLTGLLVVCVALALAGSVRHQGRWAGLLVLGVGAGLAGAAYLALDPQCSTGPFGEMDPALRPIWLDHVIEVTPLPDFFRSRTIDAIVLTMPLVLATLAIVAMLSLYDIRRDSRWWTLATLLAAAGFTSVGMVRMLPYAAIFAAIILAGALPRLLPRKATTTLIGVLAMSAILSPHIIALALTSAIKPFQENQTEKKADGKNCRSAAELEPLARLPAGLVLADIDLGPAILAQTPHSALAAPYHRMSYGLRLAHDLWSTKPANAATQLRQNGVGYVVLCSGLNLPMRFPEDGLRQILLRGETPDGLGIVPSDTGTLIWRVRQDINHLEKDRAAAQRS